MKSCKLLLVMITLSCTSFSQTLSPILRQYSKDTLFCFTTKQARYIAQQLATTEGNKTLNKALSSENSILLQALEKEKAITTNLSFQLQNMQQLHQHQNIHINHLRLERKRSKRRHRWQRTLLGSCLGIISTIAIVK